MASGLETCTLEELRGAITFYFVGTDDHPAGYHAVEPLRPPGRLCQLISASRESYEDNQAEWALGTWSDRLFTHTSVPRPVEFASGQRVAVEVVFTFSSSTRRDLTPAAAAAAAGGASATTPPPGTSPPGGPAIPGLLP